MSENTKNRSTVIDRFGGIDCTKSYIDHRVARSIENFRVLADGSIEKRGGFDHLCHIGTPVRAVYSFLTDGEYVLYALVSSNVLEINYTGNIIRQLGTVETTRGNACFFHYRETMYLMDEKNIYEYSGESFNTVNGYVPLVAKDWPTTVVGEIYEPRNIITRHARATYKVDRDSIYLCTKDEVESIEALYINGLLMNPSTYRIDSEFKTINVQNMSVGDTVEVHFTYKNGFDELMQRLCSSTSCSTFGGIGGSRIFLGGANRSGTVFTSEPVSVESLDASRKHYPQSGDLYFPLGREFQVGDGMSRVMAMTRFYDNLIIFTDEDVWIVNPDEKYGDPVAISSANSRIGCPVNNGAVISENTPISIGKNSIYAWDTVSGNKLSAVNISAPIAEKLSPSQLKHCGIYYDVFNNEIWIYDNTFPTAWIYNTGSKAWYSYTNIKADKVFDFGRRVAFIHEGELFVYNQNQAYDVDSDGDEYPIIAKYVSGYSDFGIPEKKNLCSFSISAKTGKDDLKFIFERLFGKKTFQMITTVPTAYKDAVYRHPVKRYDKASFSIESYKDAKPKIYSLTLTQCKASKRKEK